MSDGNHTIMQFYSNLFHIFISPALGLVYGYEYA